MNLRTICVSTMLMVLLAGGLTAEETPQLPQPSEEHQWLKKFEGTWKTQAKAEAGPNMPAMECSGTIKSQMLGGFWVLNEMTSEAGGMTCRGVQTIGYNPEKKKFVGTWVDSMTNHMWQYEGTLNESGTTLTLSAEGPNIMAGGEMMEFQDVYEFTSDDEVRISSRMLGKDGEWVTFMQGTGKRVK